MLVLPSLYEGMSHTLLEAMSLGLPCIASSCGGNAELISHDHDGVLCAPHDAGALANAIRSLFADEAKRRALGDNAQRRASEFDMLTTVRSFVDLLV